MNLQSTVTLHSGSDMPILGLGTWQLDDSTSETIEAALQLGYRMIDTSGDYGTQAEIGKALKHTTIDRSDVYVVTKVEETEDAYEATRKNLVELQEEYADLVLIHRPPEDDAGLELWQGLIRAKKEGFAKDIGISNYSEEQIEELVSLSEEVPVVHQIEWSPFGHNDDMFTYCQLNGIIIQAYSPLTHGERLHDQTLHDIAANYSKTPAQLLMRWNLQLGTVPIAKANKLEHLKENIDVFNFDITVEDMETLSNLNRAYSSLA